MSVIEREPFSGRPARLKFEGRSYMLDPDPRQAFRGVEVVRADTHTGAVEALRELRDAVEGLRAHPRANMTRRTLDALDRADAVIGGQ